MFGTETERKFTGITGYAGIKIIDLKIPVHPVIPINFLIKSW